MQSSDVIITCHNYSTANIQINGAGGGDEGEEVKREGALECSNNQGLKEIQVRCRRGGKKPPK